MENNQEDQAKPITYQDSPSNWQLISSSKLGNQENNNVQVVMPEQKRNKNSNDQINFTRLQLLYIDELNDIGKEFVDNAYRSQFDPAPEPGSPGHKFTSYCEDNFLFFQPESPKKVILPRRRDSSRVEWDGVMRRRGSFIDHNYSAPGNAEIETMIKEQSRWSPNTIQARSPGLPKVRYRLNAPNVRKRKCDNDSEDAEVDSLNDRADIDWQKPKTDVTKRKTQMKARRADSEMIGFPTAFNPNKPREQHHHRQASQSKLNVYQSRRFNKSSDPFCMTSPSMKKFSNRHIRHPSMIGRAGQSSSNNLEISKLALNRMQPYKKLSLVLHRSSMANLDLAAQVTPVTLLIHRELSVRAAEMGLPFQDIMNSSAEAYNLNASGENFNSATHVSGFEFQNINQEARKSLRRNIVNEKLPSIEIESYRSIDSMSSDYADSTVENGIKAFHFFAKENTTRINIGKQKQVSWARNMKAQLKKTNNLNKNTTNNAAASVDKKDSKLTIFLAKTEPEDKQANLSSDVKSSMLSLEESSSDQQEQHTSRKLGLTAVQLKQLPYRKGPSIQVHRTSVDLTSDESSPIHHSPFQPELKSYQSQKRLTMTLKAPYGGDFGSGQRTNEKWERKSSLTSKKDKSASNALKEKSEKLERLKDQLHLATWEQKEDKEAEIRYARFLSLQQLSKRIKRFYKVQFSNVHSNAMNFRTQTIVNMDEQVDPNLEDRGSVFSSLEEIMDSDTDPDSVSQAEDRSQNGQSRLTSEQQIQQHNFIPHQDATPKKKGTCHLPLYSFMESSNSDYQVDRDAATNYNVNNGNVRVNVNNNILTQQHLDESQNQSNSPFESSPLTLNNNINFKANLLSTGALNHNHHLETATMTNQTRLLVQQQQQQSSNDDDVSDQRPHHHQPHDLQQEQFQDNNQNLLQIRVIKSEQRTSDGAAGGQSDRSQEQKTDSNSCHLSAISPNVVNFMSAAASSQRVVVKQVHDSRQTADELVRQVSCLDMQFSESEEQSQKQHQDFNNNGSNQPKSSLFKQRNAQEVQACPGAVDAQTLASKLFQIQLKTLGDKDREVEEQPNNNYVDPNQFNYNRPYQPAIQFKYQGIDFVKMEKLPSQQHSHEQIDYDLSRVEENSKESKSNDISVSDFSFVHGNKGDFRISQTLRRCLDASDNSNNVSQVNISRRDSVISLNQPTRKSTDQIKPNEKNKSQFYHLMQRPNYTETAQTTKYDFDSMGVQTQFVAQQQSQTKDAAFHNKSIKQPQQVPPQHFGMSLLAQPSPKDSGQLVIEEEQVQKQKEVDDKPSNPLKDKSRNRKRPTLTLEDTDQNIFKAKSDQVGSPLRTNNKMSKFRKSRHSITSIRSDSTESPMHTSNKMSKFRKSRHSITSMSNQSLSPPLKQHSQQESTTVQKSQTLGDHSLSLQQIINSQSLKDVSSSAAKHDSNQSPQKPPREAEIIREEQKKHITKRSTQTIVNLSILDLGTQELQDQKQKTLNSDQLKMLRQIQLSPNAAEVYNSSQEFEIDKHDDNLECLKNLFVQTKGRLMSHLKAGEKRGVSAAAKQEQKTDTSVITQKRYETEPNTTSRQKQAQRHLPKYFVSQSLFSRTKPDHLAKADIVSTITMNETLSKAATDNNKGRNQGMNMFSKSTSAAYRKAQRFSEKSRERRSPGRLQLSNTLKVHPLTKLNVGQFSSTANKSKHRRDNSFGTCVAKALKQQQRRIVTQYTQNSDDGQHDETVVLNLNDIQVRDPSEIQFDQDGGSVCRLTYRSEATENHLKNPSRGFALKLSKLQVGDANGGDRAFNNYHQV